MKNMLLVLLFAGFVSALCISQEIAQTSSPLTIRDRGSWGLQFGVSGLNITDFQGGMLCYQKNKPNNSAVRIGLEMRGKLSEDQKKYPDNIYSDSTNTTSTVSLTITTQVIKYADLYEHVMVYFGGGPLFGGSYAHYKSTYYDSASTNYSLKLGVSAVIGAEWFLKKNLSVLAEYCPSLVYLYEKHKSIVPYEYINTTEQLSLQSNEARVGLSFYFK